MRWSQALCLRVQLRTLSPFYGKVSINEVGTVNKKFFLLFILYLLSSKVLPSADQSQLISQMTNEFLIRHGAHEYITAVSLTVNSPKLSKPITVSKGSVSIYQHTRINEHNLFQVGSFCKSFVVTILLKLESDKSNHFSINDPITKYFPEYPKWHHIKVKQLMNMTSGIPDYFSDKRFLQNYAANPYQPALDWTNIIYQKALLFTPGTKFNYSNTNYILLGRLVEKISGHTLLEEINNKIINPLALKHTYFIPGKMTHQVKAHLVHGYQNHHDFLVYFPRGTDVTKYNLSYLGPAGAMISTSEDISLWINALFTPGKVLTFKEFQKMRTFVSQTTARPIQQLSSNDPYAFGLGISAEYNINFKSAIYIYQGVTLGYRALYVYVPTYKTSIVIIVNSNFSGKPNHLVELVNKVGEVILST